MILDRRRVLAGAGSLVAAELVSNACGRPPAPALRPDQAAVAATDLAGGRRVVVRIGENPVEVFRDGGRIVARMLRCTHTGCVVRWNPDARVYLCPCHDGRFDENGNVVAGPPPGPLRELPAAVRSDRIVVG